MKPKRKEESPEKCILAGEVAQAWNVGKPSVLSLFAEEPGVVWVEVTTGSGRKTRELSIPESVLMRIYEDRLSKRGSPRAKPKRDVASSTENTHVREERSRRYLLRAAKELWSYEHAHGGSGLAFEIASFLGYQGDDAGYVLQAWFERESRKAGRQIQNLRA